MMGNVSAPYTDHGGFSWNDDHFCSGGNSFSVTGHAIQSTEDPQLFASGRRGVFHCNFPVPPGTYEVHLLFAETSGLQEASRNVAFSIIGGPPANLDVVDDAGGNDIAITKIITDVVPEGDGTIHLDSTTSGSSWDTLPIVIPMAMFGCQTSSSLADALVVSEVIYPKSPMVVFTNGIDLDTSVT